MSDDEHQPPPAPQSPPPPPPPPPPRSAPPPPAPWPTSSGSDSPADGQKGTTTHYILPTGRSPWAIAAGYLGLLSPFPIVHLAAVVTGVLGLRQIAAQDTLAGKGRAWLGIVLGSVFTVVYGAAIVLG